jgi:hypothetical protein
LDRAGGECSLRDLYRSYSVRNWVVEQAEEAGWVAIFERKPAVGRPSRVAVKLSGMLSAKLPPKRNTIPQELSIRHWRFAFELASIAPARNEFGCSLCSATRAYLIAFPQARSRAGAAASASRLRKKPIIQAARRWFMANDLHSYNEEMPATPAAIYERLADLRRQQEAKRRW